MRNKSGSLVKLAVMRRGSLSKPTARTATARRLVPHNKITPAVGARA